MSERIYLYPVVIRVWHLINALLIIMLIFTGISLQYSDPAYPFMRFDLAVSIHNICGIVLSINYLIFFFGNRVSGNNKPYHIKLRGFINRLWLQFHYYTRGLFKGASAPFPVTSKENKFNPLQQFTYFSVMYLVIPIIIVTGWGLLFPFIIPTNVLEVGGIFLTDLMHVIGGFIVSIFLFIHVYFCTIGKNPLKNFKSIITGWHE